MLVRQAPMRVRLAGEKTNSPQRTFLDSRGGAPRILRTSTQATHRRIPPRSQMLAEAQRKVSDPLLEKVVRRLLIRFHLVGVFHCEESDGIFVFSDACYRGGRFESHRALGRFLLGDGGVAASLCHPTQNLNLLPANPGCKKRAATAEPSAAASPPPNNPLRRRAAGLDSDCHHEFSEIAALVVSRFCPGAINREGQKRRWPILISS